MHVPKEALREEIEKLVTPRPEWPFLEVRAFLEGRGVRVPALVAADTSQGWILLEDLGDDTLAEVIGREPSRKESLYRLAVEDLARAQKCLHPLPEGCIVATRAFDEDLLLWELEHFHEWGLRAQGIEFSADELRAWEACTRPLAQEIAGLPRGFVHRDYQSRNLMVLDGALVWIDFQDALLGPKVYDLVALLSDSYQTFAEAFVEQRLSEYAAASGANLGALVREFYLVTVQRKLKDAGRFIFIDRVKKNPAFLPFFSPSLAKVKHALQKLLPTDARMRSLFDLLRAKLPEQFGPS